MSQKRPLRLEYTEFAYSPPPVKSPAIRKNLPRAYKGKRRKETIRDAKKRCNKETIRDAKVK